MAQWTPGQPPTGLPFVIQNESPRPGAYVNGVAVHSSPWDVIIDFARQFIVTNGEEGPQVGSQFVVQVVMSPQHAKAFHALLGGTIEGYESQFGEIADIHPIVQQMTDEAHTRNPDVPVLGVGGQVDAWSANLLAGLCGEWFSIPVLFETGRNLNLLGREGVFDSLQLAFVHGVHVLLASVASP